MPPLLLLTACAGPLNNELGLGNQGRVDGRGVWTPPTLSASLMPTAHEGMEASTDPRTAPVYMSDSVAAVKDSKPSVTGIDREWTETPLLVPNDLPAHQPRMTWSALTTDTPRSRGQYPTAQSALSLGSERHNNEQVKEAFIAPFVAASDMVLALPRFFAEHRPKRPTRTGMWPYERQPRREALTTDPVSALPPPPAPPSAPAQPAPDADKPNPKDSSASLNPRKE